MKARLTTWVAALLLVSAIFGVPIARQSAARIAIYQICCEREEVRAEQVAETREPPAYALPADTAAAPRETGAAAILDYSRFQRPPPSSTRNH